ncbi:CD226 antigen isoform X2 [Ambystoma mexicanum]|uniref:CD226 antigen isoform X2 n=1 Tax=Ambystoma mexicanum TaxID=8296 RepID=UPI0037E7A6B7
MEHLLALLTILQLFHSSVDGTVADETVKLAQTMALKCHYPGTSTIVQVTWSKNTDLKKERIAVFDREHGINVHENYRNRVDFVNLDLHSNDKSLFFTQTLLEDVGLHMCSVHAFPDGIWEKKIHVIQADRFEEITSASSNYGTMLGQNATLVCRHTSRGAVQRVTWEKMGADIQTRIAVCNLSKGAGVQHYGPDYKDRCLVLCEGPLNSSLTIGNIKASDEGLYRCHFETDTGNQTSVISLNITREPGHYSVDTFIIGGVAVLALLVIILAIITIVIHCQKNLLTGMGKDLCVQTLSMEEVP